VESCSLDIVAGKRIAKPLVASSKHVDDEFFDLILFDDDVDDFLNVICWLLSLFVDEFKPLSVLLFFLEVSSVLLFVGDVVVSLD
jgi:hypothetical protein